MPAPEEMEDCEEDDPQFAFVSHVEEMQRFCSNRCTTVTSIHLTAQNLHTLRPLKNIRELQGGFILRWARGLDRLDGVQNIEITGTKWQQQFYIERTFDLKSTEGFDSLERVQTSAMIVRANESLTEVAGFPELREITQSGLFILDNPELRSLAGFDKLEYVEGDVNIKNNPKLSRCDAEAFVDEIDRIDGEVVIDNNGPCE